MRESLTSGICLLDQTSDSLMEGGGKRMRPALSLLVAGATGGVNPDSIRFAAAAELLHNATLLHDDVVDGSRERRGRPTVMSVLSSPASVLIGDFWLTRAMELVLGASRYSEKVIRIFARTLSDLAEGEMLQLEKAGSGDTTFKDYLRIIHCKTASLFEAAAVSAACSTDAPEEVVDAVSRYANLIGLAFQVRDDMLDYGDGEDIGKPVLNDLREQKITMPLLGALGKAEPLEADRIRKMVSTAAEHPEHIPEIAGFVDAHGGMEESEKVLEGFITEATEALQVLPESEERTYLEKLAHYAGSRKK